MVPSWSGILIRDYGGSRLCKRENVDIKAKHPSYDCRMRRPVFRAVEKRLSLRSVQTDHAE